MTNDKYILNDKGEPVVENDLIKWGQWLQSNFNKRIVKKDYFGTGKKKIEVSTVFLGLDHGWCKGPPVLWETMVFGGGELNGEMDRCSGTRKDAMAMHKSMLKKVKGTL